MSVMANTTPIVTTVTKPATKEKTPKDADATPRVNIQDFCEEHYEDILPVIMDKIRCDKRKEVHARLDFGESPKKRRIREGSQNLSARTLSARTLLTEIVLRAETAPATSKNQEGGCESPVYPSYRRAGTNDGGNWKSKSKAQVYGMRMTFPWPVPGFVKRWIRAARVWFDELPLESIDGYKNLKAAFLAYFMQQKKYVKDPVKIYNIKKRDGETIEEFMERFKVETERMKGAPKCIWISEFMHGVNNPELTKRLNEHVPKTMEELMIAATAFIRGEAAAAGKKKGHTS
ncbi:reverse transcriptase domain-containing protein [Tanacetum coccineum]